MTEALKKKETFSHYLATLRFALYCISHPLDGFWDLTHERRGSIAAANTILFLTVFARVGRLGLTSKVVLLVNWNRINIFLYIASVLFPLALWVVGNWGLTTLFDGKGRLWQVYMATCYALTPYPLLQFPMMLMSHGITAEEVTFYTMLDVISVVWAALLILCAMMQIHEYTMGKTILFTVATIFAMLVMIFILLLFFSMISEGIAYFISIYKEILFRL